MHRLTTWAHTAISSRCKVLFPRNRGGRREQNGASDVYIVLWIQGCGSDTTSGALYSNTCRHNNYYVVVSLTYIIVLIGLKFINCTLYVYKSIEAMGEAIFIYNFKLLAQDFKTLVKQIGPISKWLIQTL